MPTFIPPRPDEIEDVPQAFVPPRPDELEAEAPALTARISDVLGTWPQQRNQLPDRRTVQGVAGIPEITTPSGLTTDETAKAKLRADMAQARVKPVPVALTALVRLGAGIEQGLTLADRAQLGVRDFLNLQKLEQFLGVPPERGTQAWLDYYRKRDQFLEQQSAELEANQSPAQKKVGELAQGVGRAAAELPVNIAPGIGAATKAGAVLRSATAAGGIGGISTFNQERADGASRFEAATRGTASALVTAVTTRAFGATGVESIFQREGVSGVRNRLAQVFREAGMEGAEEMADQFQQDLLERISKNPSKPLSQSVNDVLMAGAIGSLLGGGVNAAGQLTSGTPKNQTFTPPKPNEIEPAPTDQGDRRQGAIFQPGGLDIQQPSADQPANTATLPQDSQPGAVEGTPAAPAASLASEQRVKADMQQVLADAGIQPKVAEVLAERLAEVTPKPAEVPKSPDAPVTRAELADEIGKIADAIRGNQVAPKTPDAKPQPTISPEATAATEKPTNAGGTPTVQPMPVGPAAQPAQAGATPVQTGSDQTAVGESLQAAWKAFDEQDATARDMADMLRDIENLPAPVKQAIQDLDQAREDDRNEFGDRSGLTAEAEDALINAVEQYAARPANQPQPAQAPQAEETYDLQPILAATTIAELDNVAGAEIKRLKTEKALQAVVKAMRKRAAELESQAAQKPPISAPVPPMQAQGTATAGTLPPAVVQPDPKAAQLAKLEKAGKGDTPQAKKLRKTLGLTPTPTGQSVQPAGPGTITVGTDARLSQEQKGSPSTVPNGGAITADRGATPRRRPAKPTSRGITEADGLLFTIAGDIGTLPAFIPDGIVVAQYRRLRKKWNRGQGFLTGKEKEQLARITALFPQNYEDDFGPDGQAMRAAYDAAKKAGIAGELFTVSKRAPQGGFRLTQLLDDIKDRTGKDYSAMELWAEVERLAKAHKAGGAQAEKESGQLDAAAEQEQAFKRDANKPLKPGQQAVKAETLEDVTSFRMNGQRMRVQDVQTDEGGNVVSVTLDDGNKYGTQTVDGETRIVVDDGTVNRKANAPFAAGQSPLWRSNIEDALATWQNRGTPDQLRAHLAKTKGAMDEAEWIGLDEFLTGKASVTKAEVADFVAQNKVDVHEVVKGRDSHSINDVGLTLLETGKYRVWIAQDDGSDKTFGEYSSLDDARAARERAAAYLEKENGQTKFSQYQLPGGENYRELLLTLPHKANFTVKQMPDGRWAVMNDDGQPLEKYSDKIYAEHAVKERLKNPKGGFKSTHWDEPNVVAHVRFNERTDADGKRVLLLEEVQADWHQKGRKEGYRGDQETIAKLESEYQSVRLKVFSSSGSEMVLASSRMHELGDEINKLKNGVPNAPFKQTWPMLAMKRMIRYGSENGFDRIAWTTGEQQAERYDLSKQVSEVQYDPKGKELTAYDNSPDARVVLRELVEPSKIADYVGKDVAEKLLASPLEKPDPTNAEVHSLRGNNLKLGGEGMKGFYDRILPSEVNKFVKKWGGRVGQSQLRGKGAWEIYEREGGAFIGNAKTFGEMMAAKNAGKFIKGNPDAEGRQVHSLDITPAMREAAMQGMPMFATPQGSLTPQGWQQTLTQAIYEKYQRIAETGTRGATADSRPNEGRRFDGLRAGSVDRARRLFDRITALEPGAFAGARHDEKFYDTAEGRRFQALATRANAGVVFYAAPRTSARGCTQFGNIFLNTSQTAMERAQIFEHELAHVEQQRGNKQQRELMALVDLASDEAKAFAKRYNGWLQSIGNRPLTDAEIRMELSADLVSGRNSHAGLNTLGAFANQDQAMRLALAYHGAPKTGMTGGRLPDAPLYVGNVVITPPSIGPPAFAITAYHGTPHKVDRFSTDKIGTGEGAQVYGWGLYMAENPAVAEEYSKRLGREIVIDGRRIDPNNIQFESQAEKRAVRELVAAGGDFQKAVNQLRALGKPHHIEAMEWLQKNKNATRITFTGNAYTVRLNVEPDELLDWDKPYSEQSPKVQAALRAYYDENKNRVDAEVGGAEGGGSEASYQSRINPDGGKIYNDLSAKLKAPAKNLPPWVIESEMFRGESMVGSDQRASKFLASIGIKGIRYADQFTRVADPKNRAEYEQRLATAQANLKDWKANLDRASSPTERSIAEYQIRNHKADIDHYTQLVGKTVRPSYNYVIFDGNDIRITHENGQELSAEEAAKQPQFAQGDFSFDAPESVEDQRARMAGEKAKAKAATARTDMQDRAAARLTAQDVDTTNEMFGAEVKVDKAGQGSLFASGDVLPPFDREQHAFTKGALRRAAETIIRGTSLPRQMVQAREAAGSFQKYAEETIRLEAEDVRGAINDEFRTKPERDAANARLLAYLQGEADLSTVGGPSVQKAAKRVRDEIDELSLFAVRSGMVHGPMAETWLGNTGEWLKRTYLAFDGAADWNYDTLKRRKAKGDAEITRIWNGIETYLRTQNPTMTDGQIEATMRELIDREAVEDMLGLSGGAMAGSGKRFSVETSSLLKRKKLAPEVREWMGEIKDPYAKLMQSGKWLAQFTARNLAQRHIAMIGLEMGVLSENKDGRNHVELFPQESRFVPKLDADGNPMKAEDGTPLGEYRTVTDRRHEPLSGYFTTPEFQKALEEFDQRMNSTIAGLNFGTAVGKTVLGATAWQKGALVGWNPFSWSVNSLGGFILRLSSGAVNPLHFSRALNAVARGQSVLLDRTATVGKLKARADYLMAVRAGLTGQGVLLGDIRANLQKDYQAGGGKRLLQAVRDIAKDPKAGGAWVRLKDAMNDLWRVPGEYGIRFADDVFRLSAFFDELELAKQAYPTWGEKRQIEWAGDRAANIYQTYDRLLKIFRDASRVGALNTFVSFKLEMFRNAFWIARYAKQGIASDNPALKRDGYQKAVGLMVMVTAPAALAILARGLNDVDDEEDKALKRWIVAPWDRSEALAYTKAKDGTYSYVPMGYVIPTYEVSRPFNSLWEAAGDPNPDESFKRLASGWMSDYFGPGAAIGPILEAGMNKRIGQNRPVTMREGAEGLSDRLGYVANNFTPRAFKVATESYMASTGQTGDYGRTYSNAEIATKMAGLRERTIDVNKAAPYVLRGLAYRWRDASTFQNTEERKAGENQQRIEDANRYEKETKDNIGRLYRQAWNDLKLLGVSQQALIKAESDAAIPLELRRYRNR